MNEQLAQSVRRLIDATIRTEVDVATLAAVKRKTDWAIDQLSASLIPGSFGVQQTSDGQSRASGNVVIGVRNPVAPPVILHHDTDGLVSADFVLGAAYEGPVGNVHGGVCALILDHVLGATAHKPGKPAYTGTITLRYLRGTPLGPLRAEARVDRVERSKTFAVGHLADAEGVTVKAEGVFIHPRRPPALTARADDADVIVHPGRERQSHRRVGQSADISCPAQQYLTMASLQRYTDRRVLITGGGSGIGQATVLRMLDEGGLVVAADISESGLKDTVAKAEPHGDRLTTVVMDVGAEQSVRNGVADAVKALGGLDTLVNAAGVLRSAHFMDTTLTDFEQVLRINLVGTFLVTREAIPALRNGNDPAVVNFSSTSAAFAHPYMSAYAASKGGIQAMTHALALEFAKEKIRFNSVQPGSISSGMTDGTGESKQSIGPGLPADADYSLFTKITPVLPLGGGAIFAKPDAVAAVVAMLGSSDAYFVTGTEVRVDGGTHM